MLENSPVQQADNEKFESAFVFTMKWEGGLTNDKTDPGGITNYGVCLRYLKELAVTHKDLLKRIDIALPVNADTIRHLKRWQAKEIFKVTFWDKMNCGEFPQRTAICLFDMAMNTGIQNSVRAAQRAWNKLNPDDKLDTDGIMGKLTRPRVMQLSSEEAIKALLDYRKLYYDRVVANKPAVYKPFIKGWYNRVNDLFRYLYQDIK